MAEHARRLTGVDPDVFGVSARAAQRAKHGEPAFWEASGFGPLERYIPERLDSGGRARLKLAESARRGPPSRGALPSHGRQSARPAGCRRRPRSKMSSVKSRSYEQDMTRGFSLRMAEIDKVLLEMVRRGHDFFDEMMRIARVFDLVNRSRVQRMFEGAGRRQTRRGSSSVVWTIRSTGWSTPISVSGSR